MKIIQISGLILTLLVGVASQQALAQDAQTVPQVEQEGVIHQLDVGTNSLIISGVRFRVAYDAQVQIRGSHGAFTLLRSGMKVKYLYRDYGDAREIFEISQLPDNTRLEDS